MLDEYVSVRSAREDYGVVLRGTLAELDLTVDVQATQELREEMERDRDRDRDRRQRQGQGQG